MSGGLRIVVAGAQSERVGALVQALATLLPPPLEATAWSDATPLSGHDVVLLLGLQQPHALCSAQDADIRQRLLQDGVSFQVIHGEAATLLQHARHAIARSLAASHAQWAQTFMREETMPRWQGVCEACSDPDCEHRLFRRLLNP